MSLAEPLHAPDAGPGPRIRGIAPASSMAERLARLRLSRSENVGPRTYLHLLDRFGTARRAVEMLPDLAARGGRMHYVACDLQAASAEYEAGCALGAELLTLGDADYPAMLAMIENPPPVIWYRGDTRLGARASVAMVGARNASAWGLRTARRIAAGLGEAGYVVVSGLARGIDAAAHEAALETGTLAVLAGGLDEIYPAENVELAERILETGGALVTECAMGVEPTARHFPKRNRLVSGLSTGLVLIEAAARSGSLITARHALDQGREVMACPGAPDDPRSEGCNQLIRDGAVLIRSADDVTEALATTATRGFAEEGQSFLFDDDDLSEDGLPDDIDDFALAEGDDDALAERLLSLLSVHPIDIDELTRACGAAPSDVWLALLELDIAGQITMISGGRVALAADGGTPAH